MYDPEAATISTLWDYLMLVRPGYTAHFLKKGPLGHTDRGHHQEIVAVQRAFREAEHPDGIDTYHKPLQKIEPHMLCWRPANRRYNPDTPQTLSPELANAKLNPNQTVYTVKPTAPTLRTPRNCKIIFQPLEFCIGVI